MIWAVLGSWAAVNVAFITYAAWPRRRHPNLPRAAAHTTNDPGSDGNRSGA